MKLFVAVVASALMCMAGFTATAGAAAESSDSQPAPSAKLLATRQVLRNLWQDHIFWVRAAVIAKHDKNSAAEAAAQKQIVANAKTIAGAIVPFYGQDASDALFKLLAGHWGAIDAYLNATDAKNAAAAQKAQTDLYNNAHEIAKFLSGANANWPEAAVNQMLVVHAAHHIAQIQDVYADKYDEEAQNWGQMRKHMDELGDALANGLAAQFPDKF